MPWHWSSFQEEALPAAWVQECDKLCNEDHHIRRDSCTGAKKLRPGSSTHFHHNYVSSTIDLISSCWQKDQASFCDKWWWEYHPDWWDDRLLQPFGYTTLYLGVRVRVQHLQLEETQTYCYSVELPLEGLLLLPFVKGLTTWKPKMRYVSQPQMPHTPRTIAAGLPIRVRPDAINNVMLNLLEQRIEIHPIPAWELLFVWEQQEGN